MSGQTDEEAEAERHKELTTNRLNETKPLQKYMIMLPYRKTQGHLHVGIFQVLER